MDPVGARRVCTALAIVSAILIALGGALWYLGHAAVGLTLVIAFVAVLLICLGVNSFVNKLAFHTMRLSAGRKREERSGGFCPEALAGPRLSVPAPVGGLVLPEAVPAVDGPSLGGLEGDLAFLATVGADRFEELPGPVVVPVTSVCHLIISLSCGTRHPVSTGIPGGLSTASRFPLIWVRQGVWSRCSWDGHGQMRGTRRPSDRRHRQRVHARPQGVCPLGEAYQAGWSD